MSLPATVSSGGLAGNGWGRNRYVSSAGDVYVIASGTGANTRRPLVFKTSDPETTSLFEVDSSNHPAGYVSVLYFIDVVADGDTLHILTIGSDDSAMTPSWTVLHHTFDMSTDAWGTTDELVRSAFNGLGDGPGTYAAGCWISGVRSDSSMVAFFNGPVATDMGTDYPTLQACVYSSGSWGTPFAVDNGGDANWGCPTGVLAGDRCHFLFADLSATAAAYQRTLNSSDSLETFPSAAFDTNVGLAASHPTAGAGCAYDDGGTTRVRIPYLDSDGSLASADFDSSDSPTVTTNTGISDGSITYSKPGLSIVANGTDLYAVFAKSGNLYDDVNTGAGWGTDGQHFNLTTASISGLSAGIVTRGGATIIAVVVQDGGTVKYDEYSLGGAGGNQQAAAGGASFAGSLKATAQKVLAGGAMFAKTLARRTATSVAGGLGLSGALQASRFLLEGVAGGLGLAGALQTAISYGASMAGALGLSGALSRLAQVGVAGSTALSGALSWTVARLAVVAGAISVAGTLARQTARSVAGALGLAGTLGSAKLKLQSLAGGLALAGGLVRRTATAISGGLGFAGALARAVAHTASVSGQIALDGVLSQQSNVDLAGSSSLSGALSTIKVRLQQTGGGLGLAGALQTAGRKLLGGGLSTAGTLATSAAMHRALAGQVALDGVLSHRVTVAPSGGLGLAGSLGQTKVALQPTAGGLGLAGGLSLGMSALVSGTTSLSGSLMRGVQFAAAGGLGLVAVLRRRAATSLGGTATLGSSLGTLFIPGGGPPPPPTPSGVVQGNRWLKVAGRRNPFRF